MWIKLNNVGTWLPFVSSGSPHQQVLRRCKLSYLHLHDELLGMPIWGASWKQKENLCTVQAWNLSCSTTATYRYSVILTILQGLWQHNTFSIFHLHLCLRGQVDYSLLLALLKLLKYGTWRMLRCMLVPFTNLPREFYSWNDFYLYPFTSFQLHLSENWGWKKYASLIVGSLQGRLSLLSLWY